MHGLNWFKERIQHGLPEIVLTETQAAALYRHFDLLCRWNERMDLTSIDSPEEIVSRHYCESLFFGERIPDTTTATTVLDFGSGAGFPGFPLAILRPTWKITLLEANNRRGVFLKEVARDVPNLRVAIQRGEECSVPHDWVVARAVKAGDVIRNLPNLAKKIGLLVGESSMAELAKSRIAWGEPIRVPGSDSRHCIFACST